MGKYEDARAAGYTDEQIAQRLAGPNYQKAIEAGYTPQDIIKRKIPDATISAGPLDPRPGMAQVGSAIQSIDKGLGAAYPNTYGVARDVGSDAFGWIAKQFGDRLNAASEIALNPLLRDNPNAPANLFTKPGQLRGAVEGGVEGLRGSGEPFNPMGAINRLGLLSHALIDPGSLPNRPNEHNYDVFQMLKDKGYEKPALFPEKEQQEAANKAALGFPVGSIAASVTSPTAAGLVASTPFIPPLNALTRQTLGAAGRGVLNFEKTIPDAPPFAGVGRRQVSGGFRTRGVPGISGTLEFFRIGASLPNDKRERWYAIMDSREGQSAFNQYWREKGFEGDVKVKPEVQRRVANAIETNTVPMLPAEEQAMAKRLVEEYAGRVAARVSEDLRPHELNAHIRQAEQEVAEQTNRLRVAREMEGNVVRAGQDNPDLTRITPSQGFVGVKPPKGKAQKGKAGRTGPPAPKEKRPPFIGPTPPKRTTPSIDLIHPPLDEPRPIMRGIQPDRAEALRRLEEEGMLPPRIQDSLRKRRGAEADARNLAEQGFEGPETFGQSMFRSTEKHTPKPRPDFGVGPPPSKPTKPPTSEVFSRQFAAGQDKIRTESARRTQAADLRRVRKFRKGVQKDVIEEITAWEEYTGRKVPRTASGYVDVDKALAHIRAENAKLPEFTDRVVTQEKLREIGLRKTKGGPVTPEDLAAAEAEGAVSARFGGGGRGTGGLNRRTTDPFRTTAEINEESVLRKGYESYEPPVQAAIKMGARNDSRVFTAGVANDAMDNFGRVLAPGESAPQGWSIVGKDNRLSGLKSGYTKKAQARLDRTALPNDIVDKLAKVQNAMKPEYYGKLTNFARGAARLFKKYALLSPGFIIRNVENNVVQNGISGNLSLEALSEAVKVRHALYRAKSINDLKKITVSVGGKAIPGDVYVRDAFMRGVISGGQVATDTGARFGDTFFRKWRNLNQGAEDISRLSQDIWAGNNGMSKAARTAEVNDALGKYSGVVSRGFGATARNVIPFIRWWANITRITGMRIMNRGGSIGSIGLAQEQINKAQGFSQEQIELAGKDVAEQGGIVVGKLPDGLTRVLKNSAVGNYDTNPTLGGVISIGRGVKEKNPGEVGRGLIDLFLDGLSRAYPWISQPISQATGTNLFFRSKMSGKPTPAPSSLGLLLKAAPEFAGKMGIFRDEDGVLRAPDRLNSILYSIPQQRLAGIMADLTMPNKKSGQRVAGFGGVSFTDRDIEAGESYRFLDVKGAAKVLAKYPEENWESISKLLFSKETHEALREEGMFTSEKSNAK